MQKITTFLWFDNQAEEAARFYCSIFKNSKTNGMSVFTEEAAGPLGQVMVVPFELDGVEFLALNGGPLFKFTEAISLMVHCESQEEVDYYWDKLTEGGEESQCGWLKDKYGLSWQITPNALMEYIGDPDEEKSRRALQAMMQMRKIDIETIRKAHAG